MTGLSVHNREPNLKNISVIGGKALFDISAKDKET